MLELLQRPLRPRHALVLLASLKHAKADDVDRVEVLRAVQAALQKESQAPVASRDILLGLEALAALRETEAARSGLET